MTSADLFIFDVYGLPAPQGSKKIVAGGARVIEDNHDRKVAWRTAVEAACLPTVKMSSRALPFDGPIAVLVEFYLPAPKRRPRWRLWAWRKPDLDKLVRSTLDALSRANVIVDDARVVELHTRKLLDVNRRTGARIAVKRLDDEGTRWIGPDSDVLHAPWTTLRELGG